ncbi:MAG TPA: OadG family protein [Anaerolineaceae bacterium]|nr:OadG family protein [Anaerolineaceae bacterium]HNS63339.1 OadG family protein [Anaerolineaceae bacterium]HNZ00637.1 OadG family protein [Anaerolineaceae bacterium]HOD43957.1 OadG family protein [Anaerolineaceae bacterium]HOH19943.1 OadG family protein [Anaerolineaceae bacterium]
MQMEPIVGALWITLIGMGLVFVVIVLLWGFMALLVKVTADRKVAAEDAETPEETADTYPNGDSFPAPAEDLLSLKMRAAAAAVAAALALQKSSPASRAPETDAISPWQAVLRSARLTQRNTMYTRKPRGNAS